MSPFSHLCILSVYYYAQSIRNIKATIHIEYIDDLIVHNLLQYHMYIAGGFSHVVCE